MAVRNVYLLALLASASLSIPRGLRLECDTQGCFVTGRSEITEEMLMEGDIIDDGTRERNGVASPDRLWPDGTIPYVFHRDFRLDERKRIEEAMEDIMKKTCIKFVPYKQDGAYNHFAVITGEKGCSASIGFNKLGYFRVNLHPLTCLGKFGKIQHELIHLIGFRHEHSRPDRDDYVIIDWSNVHKDHVRNFDLAEEGQFTTLGVPYNYLSVMHYPADAFSKNGRPTIIPIQDGINPKDLGQRKKVADTDIKKINLLYKCKAFM